VRRKADAAARIGADIKRRAVQGDDGGRSAAELDGIRKSPVNAGNKGPAPMPKAARPVVLRKCRLLVFISGFIDAGGGKTL